MNLKDIIIVGVALAMDAVGVSISIGVNSAINKKNKIEFIISFTFGIKERIINYTMKYLIFISE